MARDGTSLYSDITDGIIEEITESALDIIIQDFLDNPDNGYFTTTYTGIEMDYTLSGTGIPPIASGEATTFTGTINTEEYWAPYTWEGIYGSTDWQVSTITGTETVYSGIEADDPNTSVVEWRLANYRDAFLDAQYQMLRRAYWDNVTTVSGRSDMSVWNNLLDDNVSTGITYTVTGTQFLQIERPEAKWSTAIRARMSNANGKAFFASTTNRQDWDYYAAASGTHTVSGTDLIKWSTLSDAETWYIELPLGNNIMTLPDGIETLWSKMYLTGSGYTTKIIDFDFSDTITADDIVAGTLNTGLVQIGDAGGKMIISGSTIKIYDDSDNLIIELGDLS